MNKRTLQNIAAFSLGLGLFGAGNVVANNSVNASAKTSSAKVINYTNIKNTKVHATTGTIYSSAHLTKVAHYAKNYKTYTFTRTNQAKVKKSNGKVAIYQYITSSNGKVKGWIWHSYLKDGSAPTTSSSQDAKASSQAKGKEIVKNWKPGHMTSFNPAVYRMSAPKGSHLYKGFESKTMYEKAISESKKIGHIKSGSVKPLDMNIYDDISAEATLTNGHTIVWNMGYYKQAVELIPGIINENKVPSLSNHTGHYVNYWVDDYAYDNENVSFEESEQGIFGNHYKEPTGYHELENGGHFSMCINDTTNIINPSKKILVSSAQAYMDDLRENIFGISD